MDDHSRQRNQGAQYDDCLKPDRSHHPLQQVCFRFGDGFFEIGFEQAPVGFGLLQAGRQFRSDFAELCLELGSDLLRVGLELGSDLLQVQRLKKRKLGLRDRIAFLEDQLTPDIIA